MSSSRRFKQDIRDLGDTTKQVMGLRPVRFRYKTQGPEGPDQYGLIAEEVNEVSPDLVGRGQDGQIDSVRYDRVNILLLSEVQKQHRMIQAQQTTIKAQQAKMEAQQAQIEGQQARMETQQAAMKFQQAQTNQLMRQVREVQAALKASGRANSAIRTVKAEATTVRQ